MEVKREMLTLSLRVGSFNEYNLFVISFPIRYLNISKRNGSDSRKYASLSLDQHKNLQLSSAVIDTYKESVVNN